MYSYLAFYSLYEFQIYQKRLLGGLGEVYFSSPCGWEGPVGEP